MNSLTVEFQIIIIQNFNVIDNTILRIVTYKINIVLNVLSLFPSLWFGRSLIMPVIFAEIRLTGWSKEYNLDVIIYFDLKKATVQMLQD